MSELELDQYARLSKVFYHMLWMQTCISVSIYESVALSVLPFVLCSHHLVFIIDKLAICGAFVDT
jgi:hypothetical protein